MEPTTHILLVVFPMQGHINPGLEFAKRLIRNGARVTVTTSLSVIQRMSKLPDHEGLCLAPFSDGYDDGYNYKQGDSVEDYLSQIKQRGIQKLRDLISSGAEQGHPVMCVVYSLLLPWASEVARELDVPSALLWTQPATVLDIYYYYFFGYKEKIDERCNCDPNGSIMLPSLPLKFTSRDLPSFFAPDNTYSFALPAFRDQFLELEKEPKPRVLVNTFDALEPEALKAIEKYNLTGIGPLVPSAFLDGNDPSDDSFRADIFQGTKEYKGWLNSQAQGSVVYVSFGSIAEISKRQTEEIAHGLRASGRPFLWVMRENEQAKEEAKLEKEEDPKENKEEKDHQEELCCRDELEKQGMIVPWCSQLEVLSHPSLGCFLTHCGWNSTLESLACGVPVVAFPQWTDQTTNAKLLEDAWGTGVRVKATAEDGTVEAGEVKRCLDVVLGDRREELKGKALKWRELAKETGKEGGSSYLNLKAFIDDVSGQRSHVHT